MPIYEYKCPNGHAQELNLSSKQAPKRVACLKCDQWAEKHLTPPAVRFMGDGFTRTSA